MMQPDSNTYYTPEQAILPVPPQVETDASLAEAVRLMNNSSSCDLSRESSDDPETKDWKHICSHPGCVVVTEEGKLKGILTERDIVRLTMNDTDLETTQVSSVMNYPVFSLTREDMTDLVIIYNLMRRHRVRHVPIVDDQKQIEGLVTISSVRKTLNSSFFLRFRQVKEVMYPQVVTVLPTDSVRAAVERLSSYNISCVVVVEPEAITNSDSEAWGCQLSRAAQKPIGILTERDILQFKALGLDLNNGKVAEVMSAPLVCIKSDDTLDNAQDLLRKLSIRRLVVQNEAGYLEGIFMHLPEDLC